MNLRFELITLVLLALYITSDLFIIHSQQLISWYLPFLIIFCSSIFFIFLPIQCRFWLVAWLVICMGYAWINCLAHVRLAWSMPLGDIQKSVRIEGTICDLPKVKSFATEITVQLSQWQNQPASGYLHLYWYGNSPKFAVGDVWHLNIKAKPPHALANPDALNYARQLFFENIKATGYVLNREQNVLVAKNPWRYPINHLRESIVNIIGASVADPAIGAFLAALTTGSRGLMSQAEEKVFEHTGTTYLVVISGLHISVIASVAYSLAKMLWRRGKRWLLKIPADRVGWYAALIAALFYGVLAGFPLPTQRAMIMIISYIVCELSYRVIPIYKRFLFALIFILVLQPFAIVEVSFWLSFVAVFWIYYVLSARIGKDQAKVLQWCHLQLVIWIGLLPLTLYYFHEFSWVSIPANLLALPWVEWVLLPLCVFSAGIAIFSAKLGHQLFLSLSYLVYPIWHYLIFLAEFFKSSWYQTIQGLSILFFLHMAIALGLAPKGWPLRGLGFIFCLPFLYPKIALPKFGDVWITVFDVGQGLSVWVETANHRLLYDTGPRFSEFDTGQQVILPFLKNRNISSIDRLVVSHGDNDHSGGAAFILTHMPVAKILTSIPKLFTMYPGVEYCHAGERWQWDGIEFEIVFPFNNTPYKGNNSSCVLKITTGAQSALLTGDIEKQSENQLVATDALKLQSTVLVVPHHGSKTSSSPDFVSAVAPRYVLFSLGYYNRYKFPAAIVIRRYQDQHALILTTANLGAITVQLSNQRPITVNYVNQIHYFWQKP